ncbi:MAG: hypothetical protein ACREBJ_11240, partial [Nitrosotalea sp.]
MSNIELCNDGRCPRVRSGEGRHPVHAKIDDKFSNENWKKFMITFWTLMVILVIALTIASWKGSE